MAKVEEKHNDIESYIKNYKNNIIKIVPIGSSEYPSRLLNIKNAPKKLHIIGNMPDPNKKTIGIVGARAASDYGITLAKTISKNFSNNDIQVISGLAMGIDVAAHIGAISVEKPTFAVLGCGVNICYPTYNNNIYNKIVEYGGGIISELDEDTPPIPYNFPLRNRIISGLSDVVIVVEAKKTSGSLITADYALEQGKTIFACPGRVGDSLSIGTNNLIKQGAYILTSVDDVLSYLGLICDGILPKPTIDIDKLDYYEKIVYEVLEQNAIHIDEIVVKTKLPIAKIYNVLMSLELSGLAEMTIQNYYKKIIDIK